MKGFSGGLVSKESACNAGDPCLIPKLGRSLGEGNGNPLQYSCWRIPWTEELGGLNPWGHKELDTTERLSLSLSCIMILSMFIMIVLPLELHDNLSSLKIRAKGKDHKSLLRKYKFKVNDVVEK